MEEFCLLAYSPLLAHRAPCTTQEHLPRCSTAQSGKWIWSPHIDHYLRKSPAHLHTGQSDNPFISMKVLSAQMTLLV